MPNLEFDDITAALPLTTASADADQIEIYQAGTRYRISKGILLSNITSLTPPDDSVTTPKIVAGAVTNSKVAPGIDAVKLANGTITNTEFQYLDGVTSPIQTQINTINTTIANSGTSGATPLLSKTVWGLAVTPKTIFTPVAGKSVIVDKLRLVATVDLTAALAGKQFTVRDSSNAAYFETYEFDDLVLDGAGKMGTVEFALGSPLNRLLPGTLTIEHNGTSTGEITVYLLGVTA